jgi:hypothetical protein
MAVKTSLFSARVKRFTRWWSHDASAIGEKAAT